MKANRIIIALVMLMAGMSSCQDWFDVSPKADVKAEDMFEAESGFRDILTGVYGLMIHENLYGRQLTFGYTDVLAQYYNQITTQEHEYIKTVDFKYNEPVDKAVIEKIWSTQYKAFARRFALVSLPKISISQLADAMPLYVQEPFDLSKLLTPPCGVNIKEGR